MKTCSICLCDDIHLIHPKNCSCKIFLHETCLENCKKHGLLCPICRLKDYSPYYWNEGIHNIEIHTIDRENINEDYIIRCPYNPRLFSGLIVSSIIGIVYLMTIIT